MHYLDYFTENLKIEFNGPDKRINARIMDGRLGNFTIGFTPRKAGWYTLTFLFKGEIIADDIVLPVADGTNNSLSHSLIL
jgi:hypothetical protein